jgi:hypothetical protein
MKKMSFIAVSVLMMISTSNAFADASCSDIRAEISASKARIDIATEEVGRLEGLNAQIQTSIITNSIERKDDSMILGNGQERLREDSFQVIKAHANRQEEIIREDANIKALTVQYSEQCSGFDKFE